MTSEKDSLLNQAFDLLSKIPYLKIIMKILFLLTGGLMAFSFLFGYWQSNKHLLMTAVPCILGNAIIAYLFRLWDQREKNKKKILTRSNRKGIIFKSVSQANSN